MGLAEAVEESVRSRAVLKQSSNTLAAYRRDLAAVGEVLAGCTGCSSATDLALDQVTGRSLRAAFADFAEPGSVKRTALSQFPYSPAPGVIGCSEPGDDRLAGSAWARPPR